MRAKPKRILWRTYKVFCGGCDTEFYGTSKPMDEAIRCPSCDRTIMIPPMTKQQRRDYIAAVQGIKRARLMNRVKNYKSERKQLDLNPPTRPFGQTTTFQDDSPAFSRLLWRVAMIVLWAFLFLGFAKTCFGQNPNTSNLVIVAADGSNYVLPALNPSGDNIAALKAAVDWCEAQPGRETLRIPPGTWKISEPFELVTDLDVQAEMVELTNFDATFQRAIIVAGSSDHPSGGGTRPRADRVSITGLTITQNAATSAASNCMFFNTGDDCRLTRVTAKNAKHEGLVSGGFTVGWVWDRCQAINCGAGDAFRGASGAGINCNGMLHVLKDCVCDGCTQSYEHGGNQTTFVRCQALNGTPGIQGPSYGFNLGNSVVGLGRTKLIDCKSTGHPAAITMQNVNGRLGGLTVDGFDGTGGGISFAGGKPTNIVPNQWETPADEPCYIVRSKLRFTSAHQGAITYNPGPTTAYAYAGHCPLYVLNCTVDMTGVPIVQQIAPHFGVAGAVDQCIFIGCGVVGQDSNPIRGDFQTFSSGTNPSPANSGKLRSMDCWATRIDGTPRFFHTIRETPE